MTTAELKAVVKIAIGTHFIDVFGHFLFRVQTQCIIDKHVSLNEDDLAMKKKKKMQKLIKLQKIVLSKYLTYKFYFIIDKII